MDGWMDGWMKFTVHGGTKTYKEFMDKDMLDLEFWH